MTGSSWVRAARREDAPDVAAIQVRAWFENHSAALGTQVPFLDPEPICASWVSAIENPPTPRHHVLVAQEDGAVVGFAALAPVESTATGSASVVPPTAEIVALEVDPRRTRGGHGSRLLAACADLAREAGATSVITRVLEDDGARAGFLTGAGFRPAGPSRELDAPGRPVREDAWSALL